MTAPPSLVRRLVAFLVILTIASGIVAAAIGSITIRREINEAMDGAMKEAAGRLAPLALETIFSREPSGEPIRMPGSSVDDANESMVYQVRDAQGRLLLHSRNAPVEPLAQSLDAGFSNARDWRIYTLPAVSHTIFVQVAEPLSQRREETIEAASGFLVPMAVFVPLSGLIAWLAAAHFFKPITGLLSEISRRHGGNLDPIPTGAMPGELEPIAASVNGLMDRLLAALDAEREFAANAAHELRTPLAGALAQTERLLAEAPAGPIRARAEKIRAALSRLGHLSEKLLQLARADAVIAGANARTDLVEIVEAVVAEYASGVPGVAHLKLENIATGRLRVAIDADALAIVLRNLIENAVKHGDRGSDVIVRVGPRHEVSVINAGPIVPPDVLDTIIQRFRRGPTLAAGAGLGLAICDRILRQVKGRLELVSPAGGRDDGFESRIRLE